MCAPRRHSKDAQLTAAQMVFTRSKTVFQSQNDLAERCETLLQRERDLFRTFAPRTRADGRNLDDLVDLLCSSRMGL